MKKFVLIIIILILDYQGTISQTKIITYGGNQFFGIVTEEKALEIRLKTLGDEIVTVPKSLIKSMDLLSSEIRLKSGLLMTGYLKSLRQTECDFLSNDSITATIKYDNIEFFKINDIEIQKYINSKIKIKILSENKEKIIPAKDENTEKSTGYSKYGLALGTPGGINFLYGYSNSGFCMNASLGGAPGIYGLQLGPGVSVYSSRSVEFNILLLAGLIGGAQITYKEFYGPIFEFYASGFHLQGGAAFGSGKPAVLVQIGYTYRIGN